MLWASVSSGETAYIDHSSATSGTKGHDIALSTMLSGLEHSLMSVASSGDRIVAISENGLMLNSISGVEWDSVRPTARMAFYDIAWTNDHFLALAHDNVYPWPCFLISREGYAWMSAFEIPPASEGLYSSAFSGDQYLAVGYGGQVFSSSDALSWSVQVEPSATLDRNLFSVIWAESIFVASGEMWHSSANKWQGTVGMSRDGADWVWHNIDSTGLLFDLACHDGRLFAVGYVGSWGRSRAVIASTDREGIWATRVFDNAEYFRAIESFGRGLIAAGSGGAVVVSSGGDSWKRLESGTDQPLNDIAIASGSVIIVGKSGTILRSALP